MKKLFAILLAVATLASMATVASATNTTTLTTTVPAASYTLNIPADQTIAFGATSISLEKPSVTDATGFAVGKNLEVTVTYDAFTCPNTNTTIPISLQANYETEYDSASGKYSNHELPTGSSLVWEGNSYGSVSTPYDGNKKLTSITVFASSADWGKALAGEYTATITFTAEVVAG